ncbi:MAG: hypothetical protein HY671_04950 [Chloroflexi bacterium]|nr:hypothetical protein [Chloroflexota bacterium]
MPFKISGLAKADVQSALSDQGYTAARATNLDAAISSRAAAADYTAARAAKLDQLDAAITSRAAPGAAMDLAAGAKTAIWNEAVPGSPTAGSFGERIKNNLDASISSRPSGADWTAARAGNLDAAISSRASAADYTAARAAKLDQLDAAITSRAAPGAAMDLAAGAKTALWNEAIPGSPTVGSFGERIKNNLDAAISGRASVVDYTAARAAKLDQLDAAITSRAAPGAAMDLAAGAKTAIWNEAVPGSPTVGSFGERVKNNLDAAITSRASPTDVGTQLDGKGVTSTRMARLDQIGQSTNSGSVAAAGNSTGLTVSLDTSGGAGQAKSVIEVRYSGGGAATFYAEGSDDNTNWYQGDTFSEAGVVANRLIGYLNTHRYFRFRSPTTGIDLSFEVRALL